MKVKDELYYYSFHIILESKLERSMGMYSAARDIGEYVFFNGLHDTLSDIVRSRIIELTRLVQAEIALGVDSYDT